jgi:uncharacterized lipoprotein YmbA
MREHPINMKIVTICLCMALLSSCTSKPLSVRYYLLHTPMNNVSDTITETKTAKAKPVAVLKLVNVADYLRQSSLVMQVNQHELYYSRQDVWAEKLQSSFYKALLQDLNVSSPQNYVASSSPSAKHASNVVTIKLEHFHTTDSSTVVSSGQYWLSVNDPQTSQNSKNQHIDISSHSFFFETPLKQDGYAHAVEQLRATVVSLSRQIEKDIANLPKK